MTPKIWTFFIIIIAVILMAVSGFKVSWKSQPTLSEVSAQVKPTIANPTPLEPVTSCTSYGLQQTGLNIELVIKKVCNTVYQ